MRKRLIILLALFFLAGCVVVKIYDDDSEGKGIKLFKHKNDSTNVSTK